MSPSKIVKKSALKKPKPGQKSISTFFKSPQQLPTPTSSPLSASPTQSQPHEEPRKSTISPPKQMTQLYLANLGSATRTTIHCSTCQMQYNKIDPNDQKLHKIHHTSILHGPLFSKPSNTSSLHTISSSLLSRGSVVVISRSSPREIQKRGVKILETIDLALGAPVNLDRTHFFPRDGKIFCLLSEEGRIISLVAAERIEFAYRRIANETNGVETARDKVNAVMGISRMWTCIAERGRGHCRGLLDECLGGFVWGVNVRKEYVAFSTPSESGMAVARRWCGREDFLVYEE